MPTYASGILIEPTSIAYTGTSASINTNGSVSFTACSTLSLNGVFSADYDNYTIVMGHSNSVASQALNLRLRASGTDASGTDYVWQLLRADGTTIQGARFSSESSYRAGSVETNLRSGLICNIYGAFLSQPTAFRSVGAEADASGDDARVYDTAGTHSLSTSYDGCTILTSSGNLTGRVCVYGMRQ